MVVSKRKRNYLNQTKKFQNCLMTEINQKNLGVDEKNFRKTLNRKNMLRNYAYKQNKQRRSSFKLTKNYF